MQIRDKLLRRYFFIYRIIIRLMFFFKCFPWNELSWLQRAWIRVSESCFGNQHGELESHEEYFMSDTYVRGLALAVHSRQLELHKQRRSARRGVRLDKRNFESHRIPLSDDRRSLREPDRFDALPPRRTRSPSCKLVQTCTLPAVNNCWSHTARHTFVSSLAHDRPGQVIF